MNPKKIDVILDNLYIKIEYEDYNEIFKLNLKKDYSNSNFLLNIDDDISENQLQQKSDKKINIDYLKFKKIICKTKDCAINTKYNKIKYDIFYLSDSNEIIIYFQNQDKFIQYKYNYEYNDFHVIRESNSKKEEYKVDLVGEKCILEDCSLFETDYLLFETVLDTLE